MCAVENIKWNCNERLPVNTMQYAMFLALKEIRGHSASEVATLLKRRLDADAPPFTDNPRFGLWQSNKKTMRRFLARMTNWLETQIGIASNLAGYLISSGSQGYDVEHVIPDQHARYADEFPAEQDFEESRNRIGGLLLLPRSFNRSYGALSYEDKHTHYLQQNILAQTFHENAYDRNPGLRRVINERNIPFQPYGQFRKADWETRQQVMTRLAEEVWNVARLDQEASPQ